MGIHSHHREIGVSGDRAAAHQNTGMSSETNVSPHNDTISGTLSLGYTGYTVTGRLEYQEIRQLLITIKAAAVQPRNLSSASKPSTIFINLVNVLE